MYVNNLQKDIQEHQLEELFKQVHNSTVAYGLLNQTHHISHPLIILQCGEVREVRIVRNTAGRPKGYAYVEFTDEVRYINLAAFQALEH